MVIDVCKEDVTPQFITFLTKAGHEKLKRNVVTLITSGYITENAQNSHSYISLKVLLKLYIYLSGVRWDFDFAFSATNCCQDNLPVTPLKTPH